MDNEVWTQLAPVVVGGLIAIVGAGIGPVVAHMVTDRSAARRERALKFEELLAVLNEHDTWLEKARDRIVLGKEADEGASPLPRALALSALYFPSLTSVIRRLEGPTSAYLHWMNEAGLRRLKDPMSNYGTGFREAYNQFLPEYNGVLDEVSDYAIQRNGRV